MLNGDEKLLDGLLAEYDAGEMGMLNGDEKLLDLLDEIGVDDGLIELLDLLCDAVLDITDNGEYFEYENDELMLGNDTLSLTDKLTDGVL